MNDINLFHGDCLELMKDLPDGSVDMILCDLPYGTSACKWDSVIPFADMWREYERIIKDSGAIVLFGSEPFSSALRMSNPGLYKYDWKWEKPLAANFLNLKYQPAKVHEDIMVFGKKAVSYSKKGNMAYFPQMEKGEPYRQITGKQKNERHNATVRSPIKQVFQNNEGTRYPRSILKFKSDKEKLHPTQKPVALLAYLIKTYTQPGDTVLDNCMGSGSSGVACVQTGRKFIGMELRLDYFEISSRRIADTQGTVIISENTGELYDQLTIQEV